MSTSTMSTLGGFRLRISLAEVTPEIWRSIDVPASLSLQDLHDYLQAVMGWTNSHLHRFRTGPAYSSTYFLTDFDVSEGDSGPLENDTALSQLLARTGDSLWYEYDFGDSWDHRITVVELLPNAPERIRCVAGEHACPPEDCGGVYGYSELAEWVRAGTPTNRVPGVFESKEYALLWLPAGWDPDAFSVAAANRVLDVMEELYRIAGGREKARDHHPPIVGRSELPIAMPDSAISPEYLELALSAADGGFPGLLQVLQDGPENDSDSLPDADISLMVEPFRIYLDVIADGVKLTGAKKLPPAVVREISERTGLTSWWFGTANREDQTYPIAELREVVQRLGLSSVRSGKLSPTAVARKLKDNDRGLWKHICSRLFVGKTRFDREAGMIVLGTAATGISSEDWLDATADVLSGRGWRADEQDQMKWAVRDTPTYENLTLLSLGLRDRRGLLNAREPRTGIRTAAFIALRAQSAKV